MNSSKRYVDADSKGVLRVGSLGVSLDSVVIAFQEGHSPETIQQLYPALTVGPRTSFSESFSSRLPWRASFKAER